MASHIEAESAVGAGAAAGEPEVERSITIGRAADELRQRWRDPQTLTRIMASFATVLPSSDGLMHWAVVGPLGRTFQWDFETVDDHSGDPVGWHSLPASQ